MNGLSASDWIHLEDFFSYSPRGPIHDTQWRNGRLVIMTDVELVRFLTKHYPAHKLPTYLLSAAKWVRAEDEQRRKEAQDEARQKRMAQWENQQQETREKKQQQETREKKATENRKKREREFVEKRERDKRKVVCNHCGVLLGYGARVATS